MTPIKRKQLIRRVMKLVWGSLNSHLPYLTEKPKSKSDGGIKFQTNCVKEYSEIIYILSQLL